MKTETKAPRGRPLQQWEFIFSPDKFDSEIGIAQFNGESLPIDQMQHLGIKASLIRQDLIERAQKVNEVHWFSEESNESYKSQLEKKLNQNIHGHDRHYRRLEYQLYSGYDYQCGSTKRMKLNDLSVE